MRISELLSLIHGRVGRARELAGLILEERDRWLQTNDRPFHAEENAANRTIRVTAQFDEEPFGRWSLIYSDGVHQLRSALDNLVYLLWSSHKGLPTKPGDIRTIGFPIYSDATQYANRGTSRTDGVSPKADSFIESVQPYHRRSGPEVDALWVLHQMSVLDKHHAPRVTAISLDEISIRIGSNKQTFPTGEKRRPLRSGSEVGVFSFAQAVPPGEEIIIDATVTLSIDYLADSQGARQQVPLAGSLQKMADRVESLVQTLAIHL